MDRNDRQAIESLFARLDHVERQANPRDAEADRYIRERIEAQPGAPYFMAQTIVVQEQALENAERRIEELEARLAQPQRSGGLLSGIFGGGQPQRPAPSAAGRASPWGGAQGRDALPARQGGPAGGGFLAGAAQTAMGVAGGVLIGNALAGLFGGNEAQAAEEDEPPADDGGADFDTGDDMDF